MSAFKVLDNSSKNTSIKAKKIINFAEQYRGDKSVYRPIAIRREVIILKF